MLREFGFRPTIPQNRLADDRAIARCLLTFVGATILWINPE